MIVVDTNVMARLVVGGEDGAEAAQLFEQDNEWAAPSLLIERTPQRIVRIRTQGCGDPRTSQGVER